MPDDHASNTAFRAPESEEWRSLSDASSPEELAASQSARSDLRQVLLSTLQMQHLVVLAGSGASLSAGGPSMQDLWNEAVGAPPEEATKKVADKVRHNLTEPNLEAFLSRSEAFLQVQHDDHEVRHFVNESKRVILKKCSAFLGAADLSAHTTFLHRLSRRRVRDYRLKVFTTNYDLCFERAASAMGGVPLDGFSFTTPRQYDPRYFSYDIIRRPRGSDDLGTYLEGVFLLYKLHGSVSWARDHDGVIEEQRDPKPEEACLIYPATGKYQQSFVQPHLESMAQFLAAVREPNTGVLVVGCGFADDHLAAPLLGAVQSNPHLRLLIVDPKAKENTAEAKEGSYWHTFALRSKQGEDVWFINAGFEQFARMIPDLKALTPGEALVKAIEGVVKRS